jgi:hypothetical protein
MKVARADPDFTRMKQFDAGGLTSTTGERQARDIVKFVRFK